MDEQNQERIVNLGEDSLTHRALSTTDVAAAVAAAAERERDEIELTGWLSSYAFRFAATKY